MNINADLQKELSMPRRMSKGLIIDRLKQRFLKLNNRDSFKMDEVDWELLDSRAEYSEALDDFERNYPQFNWRTNEEVLDSERDMALRARRNLDDEIDSIKIELKLYLQRSKKGNEYAYIKGTIPKKLFNKFKDRLYRQLFIDWPLFKPRKEEGRDTSELDEVFDDFLNEN